MKENINHPCNVFNVESNAHESFDKLAWGIEAVYEGKQVSNFLLQTAIYFLHFDSGNTSSGKSTLKKLLLPSISMKGKRLLLTSDLPVVK